MIAKLVSYLKELRGNLDNEHYVQMRGKKPTICKKGERKHKRRHGKENDKFSRASHYATVLLQDEQFRAEATEMWKMWNRQFPSNWEPPRKARDRNKVAHPYASVYHFVVAKLIDRFWSTEIE